MFFDPWKTFNIFCARFFYENPVSINLWRSACLKKSWAWNSKLTLVVFFNTFFIMYAMNIRTFLNFSPVLFELLVNIALYVSPIGHKNTKSRYIVFSENGSPSYLCTVGYLHRYSSFKECTLKNPLSWHQYQFKRSL